MSGFVFAVLNLKTSFLQCIINPNVASMTLDDFFCDNEISHALPWGGVL